MTKWKKAETKAANPATMEISDDLMSQIAGGTGKMACHTRLTLAKLGAVRAVAAF